MSQAKPLLRSSILVWIGFFIAFAALVHPYVGWNVSTRIHLITAVLETGDFSIDGLHEIPPFHTDDKAYFNGRFYCDKIIGVSLLALPFVWVPRALVGEPLSFVFTHLVAKTFAVAIPAAFSALLFWQLLIRLGSSPRRAIFLTAASVLGSMWLGYGSMFYPYVPGIATALLALKLILFPRSQSLSQWSTFAIGFLLGWTLLFDLIFALLVFGIGALWLLRMLHQCGWIRYADFGEAQPAARSPILNFALAALLFWLGVLIPLSTFAAYTYTIFGEFTIPYRYEYLQTFREGMARGMMGVTQPRAVVMYFITLHPFRGIFFWTPILFIGLAGCLRMIHRGGTHRLVGALGILSFIAYLLFNSGYYMWWGGYAMSPRMMLPMLPFALLGLAEAGRPDAREILWKTTLILGLAGVAITLPVSMGDPQIETTESDAELMAIQLTDAPDVGQFHYVRAFYEARLTIWWRDRVKPIGTRTVETSEFTNALSVVLYLAAVFGLLAAAWKLAQEPDPE